MAPCGAVTTNEGQSSGTNAVHVKQKIGGIKEQTQNSKKIEEVQQYQTWYLRNATYSKKKQKRRPKKRQIYGGGKSRATRNISVKTDRTAKIRCESSGGFGE